VLDSDHPDEPVELQIGGPGFAVTVLANRYRADLDHHGLAGGRAGFAVAIPVAATSLGQLSVHRIADGACLPHAPAPIRPCSVHACPMRP
jgi:hypothetical protein